MKDIITRITKLIDLKSILTILISVSLVVIIFANITITDESIKTLFISVASSVFTSYFQKNNNSNTGDK